MSCGNTRSRIFRDNDDRVKFISYLEETYRKFGILIHSYCLLRNHYHLFIRTPQPSLCKAMHFINASYTKYYNSKYKRKGHLFAGRFRAILIDSDNYALTVSTYIHLNPVRAGIIVQPWKYEWSSCFYFTGTDLEIPEFIDTSLILEYFKGKNGGKNKAYLDYLTEKIGQNDKDPGELAEAGLILGSEEFSNRIKNRYVKVLKKDRSIPAIGQLQKDKNLIQMLWEQLKKFDWASENEKRKFSIFLLQKHTDANLAELQRLFPELSVSGVSQAGRRMRISMEQDKTVQKRMEEIEKQILSIV